MTDLHGVQLASEKTWELAHEFVFRGEGYLSPHPGLALAADSFRVEMRLLPDVIDMGHELERTMIALRFAAAGQAITTLPGKWA